MAFEIHIINDAAVVDPRSREASNPGRDPEP